MGQADQHQKQSQLAEAALSKCSSDAEFLGNLFKRIEETEDRTDSGIGGSKMIEVTTQGATESLDASGIPVGDIGKSAGFDLSLMAVGFTDQDSRRRGAIGNGGDVHAYIYNHIKHICQGLL